MNFVKKKDKNSFFSSVLNTCLFWNVVFFSCYAGFCDNLTQTNRTLTQNKQYKKDKISKENTPSKSKENTSPCNNTQTIKQIKDKKHFSTPPVIQQNSNQSFPINKSYTQKEIIKNDTTDEIKTNLVLSKTTSDQLEQSSKDSPEEILVTIENIPIARKDIDSLKQGKWLNDNIINAYMSLIKKRSEENKNQLLPKVYLFNTYFFSSLSKHGCQNVKKWTKDIDIFSYRMLFIPMHINGNHWSLAVINFEEKTISYYDSIEKCNKNHLDILVKYLDSKMYSKKKDTPKQKEWKRECLDNIPKQNNDYDCGVFVCQFAECISRNSPINFTQKDMPGFRKSMKDEILNQELKNG